MASRIPNAVVKRVVNLTKSGSTIKEIADVCALAKSSVSRIRKQYNVKSGKGKIPPQVKTEKPTRVRSTKPSAEVPAAPEKKIVGLTYDTSTKILTVDGVVYALDNHPSFELGDIKSVTLEGTFTIPVDKLRID